MLHVPANKVSKSNGDSIRNDLVLKAATEYSSFGKTDLIILALRIYSKARIIPAHGICA